MKKVLLFTLMLVFAVTSQAQDQTTSEDQTTSKTQLWEKLKVYVGLGYATPDGNGGLLIDVEPEYAISENFGLSLRMEVASTKKNIDFGGDNHKILADKVGTTVSFTLGGKYYFYRNGNTKAYGGLGLSLFLLDEVFYNIRLDKGEINETGEARIGFVPKIGVDIGRFNVELAYNIIGDSKFEDANYTVTGIGNTIIKTSGKQVQTINQSYIGLRVGAYFGGGKN